MDWLNEETQEFQLAMRYSSDFRLVCGSYPQPLLANYIYLYVPVSCTIYIALVVVTVAKITLQEILK